MIAATGIGYLQLGVAFTIAGIGTSFCFPTVANAIMGSVPMREAGVASGPTARCASSAASSASPSWPRVFIHHGGYTNPHAFIQGFTPAVWVAVGLSTLGIIAAILTGGRSRPREVTARAVAVPEAAQAA